MNNDAIRIVLEAQAEAGRLGQASVDTEHLLLGIIALQGISTSGLMAAFNISLPDARLKVEEISGIGIHSTKDEISLPLTRLSEHVIELAWQVARNFHQINLSPEHFLIALLDEKQGHASTNNHRQCLQYFGDSRWNKHDWRIAGRLRFDNFGQSKNQRKFARLILGS